MRCLMSDFGWKIYDLTFRLMKARTTDANGHGGREENFEFGQIRWVDCRKEKSRRAFRTAAFLLN